MVEESKEQPSVAQLIVVLNWFEELKRLVPPGSSRQQRKAADE